MSWMPSLSANIGNLTAGKQKSVAEIDFCLLWSVVALLALGLIMVYSASVTTAGESRVTGHQPAFYLLRHTAYLLVGLLSALCVFQVRMQTWQRWAPMLFVLGALLLVVVLIPGIGREVNGARRWLSMVFFNLQPSELVKILTVLYAADYTERRVVRADKPENLSYSSVRGSAREVKRNNVVIEVFKLLYPMAMVMAFVGILLLMEPDFGAFVVIIAIAMGVLFLGGLRAGFFFLLIVLLALAFTVMVLFSPYRRERVLGFMNPWEDAFGRGYQLSHSLIAFGRGEVNGVGLGGSVEKLFYLPEAHTDFLLAVIAEELGFIGVAAVVILFALVVYRAFCIGVQAVRLNGRKGVFSALVAMGIGIWMGVQSFINMGVNMGLLPTKGLTLPLMSYGGSGIFVNCVAIAILLRIDWENREVSGSRLP